MDFLEKSLFVRSTKLYSGKRRNLKSDDEIHFKCSNFGAILLDKIMFTYAYISGIAQNSCLPERLSEKIIYRKKSLNSHGNAFFISKKWVIEIIPTILLFLRVLKYVELNSSTEEKFYVHKKMVESCRDSIQRILNAKNSHLTQDDVIYLYNKCIDFIST